MTAFQELRDEFKKAAFEGLLSSPRADEALSLETLCAAAAQIAENMVKFAEEEIGGPYSELHPYAVSVLRALLKRGYASLDCGASLPRRVYDLAAAMIRTRIRPEDGEALEMLVTI